MIFVKLNLGGVENEKVIIYNISIIYGFGNGS